MTEYDNPNVSFLLLEDKWGVFFIRETGTGKILGIEFITHNPTGGHKITFTGKEFKVDIEEWNDALPKNT